MSPENSFTEEQFFRTAIFAEHHSAGVPELKIGHN